MASLDSTVTVQVDDLQLFANTAILMARVARVNAITAGMHARNVETQQNGHTPAYDEVSFDTLLHEEKLTIEDISDLMSSTAQVPAADAVKDEFPETLVVRKSEWLRIKNRLLEQKSSSATNVACREGKSCGMDNLYIAVPIRENERYVLAEYILPYLGITGEWK